MDIMVKLTVSNYIYQFYDQASRHIAQGSTEQIMSDALSAYAGMLSNEVAKQREKDNAQVDQHEPKPSPEGKVARRKP